MLTAVRQKRITYVLVGVSLFYLFLLVKHHIHEAWSDDVHHKPIRTLRGMLNKHLGLNLTIEEEVLQAPSLYKANCSLLIIGDHAEILQTKEYLKDHPQPITPNQYYIKAGEKCDRFREQHGFTDSYNQVPLMFPVAYVITVHHSVQAFEQLLHAIYNEHNVYCVHVDNTDPMLRAAMEAVINCLPKVFIATKSEKMVAFGHSELEAEFHCLRDLLTLPMHWRYVLNVDENSFPLKTNTQTTDKLKTLEENNLVIGKVSIAEDHMIRYKYKHAIVEGKLVQTQEHKTPPPADIQLLHGSPYYVLTRNFVQFVMSNYYALEFYSWLNDTYSPRELYWASMNQMYVKNENLPAPPSGETHYYHMRTTPGGEVSSDTECPGVYYQNYCIFDSSALPFLRSRDELFAAKFNLRFDHTASQCLDLAITRPYELLAEMDRISNRLGSGGAAQAAGASGASVDSGTSGGVKATEVQGSTGGSGVTQPPYKLNPESTEVKAAVAAGSLVKVGETFISV